MTWSGLKSWWENMRGEQLTITWCFHTTAVQWNAAAVLFPSSFVMETNNRPWWDSISNKCVAVLHTRPDGLLASSATLMKSSRVWLSYWVCDRERFSFVAWPFRLLCEMHAVEGGQCRMWPKLIVSAEKWNSSSNVCSNKQSVCSLLGCHLSLVIWHVMQQQVQVIKRVLKGY